MPVPDTLELLVVLLLLALLSVLDDAPALVCWSC
jgi:hypothetical protein